MNTLKQALKAAQKRWGKKAIVNDTGAICNCGRKTCDWLHGRYSVGQYQMGFFNVVGSANTWDEAFAKADEDIRRSKERYAKIDKERKALGLD